jgi:hypothetical protein
MAWMTQALRVLPGGGGVALPALGRQACSEAAAVLR